MAGWSVTAPADTDTKNNFPSAHRTDKTTLRDQFQVEHDVLDSAGTATGRHKFPSGNTASRPASPPTGAIYFNTQLNICERWNGSAWVEVSTVIPPTTAMVFKQATVPTGWTRQVDAGNTDAVAILRLNGETPSAGGSWTISGITANTHGHNLAIQGVAAGVDIAAVIGVNSGVSAAGPLVAFGTPGSNGWFQMRSNTDPSFDSPSGITSDASWRPKFIDLIVGTKD